MFFCVFLPCGPVVVCPVVVALAVALVGTSLGQVGTSEDKCMQVEGPGIDYMALGCLGQGHFCLASQQLDSLLEKK